MPNVDPEILQKLRTIVRRDLKLGAEAPIADDMPFFNSDLDLDSLDILLLVTSIEKEFGIKIPSHAVGKEMFTDLSTLALYIQNNAGTAGETTASPGSEGPIDYLARLPHAPPFRFISTITEVIEGQSALGVWSLGGNEDFFAGHFPGHPVVPGALITEALAQLSGLAGPPTANRDGKLVQVDMRFEQTATPPVDIVLESKFTRTVGDLQQFEVRASQGPTTLAQGSLTLHRGS